MNALLNEAQISELGPEVFPFERRRNRGFVGTIKEGEAILFGALIHNVTLSGIPDNARKTLVANILNDDAPLEKYLWVIDKAGLKIILEATPNPQAVRKVVCHTNITGGQPALQGGELWFGDDGRLYINNKSGRYGASTTVQEKAVIDYFQSLGLNVVQLPFG